MHEIVTRHEGARPALVMTAKLDVPQIPTWIGGAFGTVAAEAARAGLAIAGPPFARYRPLDDTHTEFEVEAGFPVDRAEEPTGDARLITLPEGMVAATLHIGPYEEMGPAYEAINTWLEGQGAIAQGPPWEVYYSDPEQQPDPATWRTEIVQPYRLA